jgi:hypothetical protein
MSSEDCGPRGLSGAVKSLATALLILADDLRIGAEPSFLKRSEEYFPQTNGGLYLHSNPAALSHLCGGFSLGSNRDKRQTKSTETRALSEQYRDSTCPFRQQLQAMGSSSSNKIQRTRSGATKACTKGWTTSHRKGGLDCECTNRSPKPHCSTTTHQ